MSDSPKADSETLSVVLPPVRCTVAEKEAIQAKAVEAGLNRSAYLREVAINGEIKGRASQLDIEILHELRRIGVNMNQLAKRFNATGTQPAELVSTCAKLETALDKMMEKI